MSLNIDHEGSGNSIAGHLGFAHSFDAIDFHGKFDGVMDSPDAPAAFLILLMQSIFVVSLMVKSIVLMVLQHF